MKTLKANKAFKYVLAPLVFILVLLLSQALFTGARLDLTEQNIYSLSDGTKNILQNLENQVDLTIYYSDKASEDLTALRSYAKRVQELLAEYEIIADGKLTITVVDPEPFSEAEDQASQAGLQAVPIASGDDVYFGLSARSESADSAIAESIIPFLQPDKERFLEYQLSELIYRLGQGVSPVIGLMSTLEMRGGFDMQSGSTTPPWTIFEQLDQLYDVRWVSDQMDEIDPDIELLMLVQPENLSLEALYLLDQYVLGGGKLLLFMDPKAETLTGPPTPPVESDSDLELSDLLAKWGVQYVSDQVITDGLYGLTVSMGQGQPPMRHLGLLGVQPDGLNPNEISTSELEVINFASAGFLYPLDDATAEFNALVWTSPFSNVVPLEDYNAMGSPAELVENFTESNESFALAARLSGPANSLFEAQPEELVLSNEVDEEAAEESKQALPEFIKSSDNINVLLVSDTDVLGDRMWVQVQNFFGRRIVQPWADNGAFAHNLVEQFLGSSDLISIRSRGRFARPFEVVQDLEHQAQVDYRDNERRLQQQLEQTESKLAELEELRDKDTMMLSTEQEATLLQFQQEKLFIRKALRDVRHELDKDIESLGNWLKVLNIAIAPILLVLLLGFLVRRRIFKPV